MLPQVLLTAGVVLVSVTTAAPVAQAQPTAAPEALESSQLVPRRRPLTALYHASSGLDRQRVDRWFAAALRDSASSAAPASGRVWGWSAQSAQRVTLAFWTRLNAYPLQIFDDST